MKRRFLRFSLRGLLALLTLACVLLGIWHLLETYGDGLDVEDARVGTTIRVRARYFCPLGPRECPLALTYQTADGTALSEGMMGVSLGNRAERSWLCLYSTEFDLDPVDHPCQIRVAFGRYMRLGQGVSSLRTLKQKTVDVK
ncbi:MAG TPA: hypothetical protein VHC22_23390 [Pirellulales bacterium]|nr:hypothetical protein [Pirellulales bacterium]